MILDAESPRQPILAIDPGASGGIAWRIGPTVECCPMPDTEGGVLHRLRQIAIAAGGPGGLVAYVEQVGGYAGQAQPGSAMFTFGRGYGFLLGILACLGIRTELVTPRRWQKPLGIGTAAGLARPEWKRKLRAKAEQLYPGQPVTLKTCDALLLLDYGRHREPLHI